MMPATAPLSCLLMPANPGDIAQRRPPSSDQISSIGGGSTNGASDSSRRADRR